MTDIARYRDTNGSIHFTARDSEAAERLLKNGAEDLDAPPQDPEVTDAELPAQGDDPDPGTSDSGSGQRKRASRTTDRADRGSGEA